jgi:hypothetical protein
MYVKSFLFFSVHAALLCGSFPMLLSLIACCIRLGEHLENIWGSQKTKAISQSVFGEKDMMYARLRHIKKIEVTAAVTTFLSVTHAWIWVMHHLSMCKNITHHSNVKQKAANLQHHKRQHATISDDY